MLFVISDEKKRSTNESYKKNRGEKERMANKTTARAYTEASAKELLQEGRIRDAVNNALHYGLGQICQYAVDAENPVRVIADSFVRHVFPYYRTSKKHSLDVEGKPVPALQTFWHEVELAGCYEFGELERYALATEVGIPEIFIGQLRATVIKAGKDGVGWSLSRVIEKLKEEKFNFGSLDEILESE